MPARRSGCRRSGRRCSGAARSGWATACASSTTSPSDDDGQLTMGRLATYVRDQRVPLEMCPTSNVHTGAVASIEDHPIDLLRRLRFRVTVNTDNRLMSGVTMSSEFETLSRRLRLRPRRDAVADAERHEERLRAVRRAAAPDQRRHQARLRATDRRVATSPRPPLVLDRRVQAAMGSSDAASSSSYGQVVPQSGHVCSSADHTQHEFRLAPRAADVVHLRLTSDLYAHRTRRVRPACDSFCVTALASCQ